MAHLPGAGLRQLFLGIWALFYCIYPVAATGRTLGMAIAGLRVVRSDGGPVSWHGAVVRVLALPLSFLTLGVGFLLIVSAPTAGPFRT